MNVKQLALRALRDKFATESPIVRMLNGVFDGMESELGPDGCFGCLRERLVRRLADAVEEGRLLTYDICDLRVIDGAIVGTVLLMPMPTPYIELKFTVTDRGVEL